MTPSRPYVNLSTERFAASDIDRDQGLSAFADKIVFSAFEDLVLNSDGVSDGAPRCAARAAFYDSICPWRCSRQCDSAGGALVRYCEVLFWQHLLPYHPTETIFEYCMPCIVSGHRVTFLEASAVSRVECCTHAYARHAFVWSAESPMSD